MQIKDFEIKYRRPDHSIKIYLLGDIHCGTIHCVEDSIKSRVEKIRQDRFAFWIGMGDYGEFIIPGDKRFDPSQKAIAEWVRTDDIAASQKEWIVKLFKPIRKSCIGLLYGNHEDSIRRHNNVNIHQQICNDLEVDNLGYSAFVRLFFRRENGGDSHIITGAFTHGAGWAITKGAKLNKLRRFMDDFSARIYGMGHMHDLITDTKPYLTPMDAPFGKSKIKEQEAIGAVSGSWFRTYTKGVVASYGEQRVYPPTVIGCPVFEIDPDRQILEVHKAK